jgi:hypothetical protein
MEPQSNKYRLISTLIVVFVVGAMTVRGWNSYLRYRPATPDRFTETTGLVSSLEETTVGYKTKTSYIDIYLRASPLRFRMRMNAFAESKLILSNVKPGARAEITVWKSALASPTETRSDSVPTVYVCGVKFDGRTYGTLDEYMMWRKQAHQFSLTVNAILSTTAAVLLWQLAKLRRKLRSNPDQLIPANTAR